MPEQIVVLTGSDGKKATVTRAVATQASLVLRDILDGVEPMTTFHEGVPVNATAHSLETNERESRTVLCGGGDTAAVELPFPYFTGEFLQRICDHMTYHFDYHPPSNSVISDGATMTSSVGSSCSSGNVRGAVAGRNVMREIPRPMVLPLSEYLDAYDRHFIESWDETMTVMMVKAATLLNYDELLNLSSARLAVILSEKSIEGLRAFLGADNDFTPEEEAELKKEHERIGE